MVKADGRFGPEEGQRAQSKRRISAWAVLAAALLVALGAALIIAELRERADNDRQALLLFKDLETQAYRLSSLEWQAIAEERLDSGLYEEAQDARGRMARSLEGMAQTDALDEEAGVLQQVDEAFRAYDEALDEEFRLLAAGSLEEAEAVDEERVDPSFDELTEALVTADSVYSTDAERTDRIANAGSVFALGVAGGLIGVMFWQYERARRAATLIAAEQKALRKSEELFRYQALHDPLTNLPNRLLFMDRLRHALDRTRRRTEKIAVLFLDLDSFKVVNDGLGHKAGDQLLLSVGKRLRECLRSEDTLARLGGDEFTILLEDVADAGEATKLAEHIAERLEAPFELEGREVFIKASIGIVSSSALDGDGNPDDLLRDADTAMYEAKKKGTAGYEVFHPDLGSRAMWRLKLEGDMHRAVKQGEFRVYYQPLVDLATNRISEVEALVRWEHPERGLLAPGEFLPLAEETGLILPIGRFVLKEAARQMCEWQGLHPSEPPLMVSVNLSARQFRQPDLVGDISRTLEETGLDPRTLKLEITESIAVDDLESTIDTLRELKGMGIKLAIDDFGTGYSSLSYLKRFPIDVLKVARPFVDGLGHDPEDTAVVRATVAFAKAFNLHVTGEGIETAEQLAQLRALGCDSGQGYYFAKPLPSDAASTLFYEASRR